MLNLVEYEIYPAHKYLNSQNQWNFHALTIVGILTFISRIVELICLFGALRPGQQFFSHFGT